MSFHRLAAGCAALALAAVLAPQAAAGAGLPVPATDTQHVGAIAPGVAHRYVALRAGLHTKLLRIRRDGGRVEAQRSITGRWAVPAVTLNGATTGLSADGDTLVLVRPTALEPPRRTRLAIVDTARLTVRDRVTLNGGYGVDSISRDGMSIGLIQYATSGDPLDYTVRALDTATGRVDPEPIVDPREPDEQMGGFPFARVDSPDGRWAYTLYGGGHEVFIHALDVDRRTAACIDLHMLPPDTDLTQYTLAISRDGRRVDVRDPVGAAVAHVDTRSFAVTRPGPAPADRHGPAPAPQAGDGGFPWLILGGAALLALAAAMAVRRPRKDVTPAPRG